MSNKRSNVITRAKPDIKNKTETALSNFDGVKALDEMSEEEFKEMLETSFKQIKRGECARFEEAIENIKKH